MVEVVRKTTESMVKVAIDFDALAPDYRSKIKTPIVFLSHMLEHIAYRAGITIAVDMELPDFYLTHVVCEDLGQTVGRAVAEYVKNSGVTGYGDGVGMIDEAVALCAVSFEGRTRLDLVYDVAVPDAVEDTNRQDLETFLDGFVQGAGCTMHVRLMHGENGHHIFEAIFRGIGKALSEVLAPTETRRKGLTAGVAGKILWEVSES